MCTNIIIDRDIASQFIKSDEYADKKLKEFIESKYFKVVYSSRESQWKQEVTGKWREILIAWRNNGLAILKRDDLSHLITELKKSNKPKSQDFHILALAQITNTNFLYTDDKKLKKDFKNKEIMKNGRLYPFKSKKQTIDKFLNSYKCPNRI